MRTIQRTELSFGGLKMVAASVRVSYTISLKERHLLITGKPDLHYTIKSRNESTTVIIAS